MRRIGLLMGSFNPPHNGHVGVALAVLERGLADEVWFVVSPQNPFKDASELAPFEDRVAMVRLAISGKENMSVCEVERDLPLPSYTINTIEKLRSDYPGSQFVILAGSDIAAQVATWHRADELQSEVAFLYYPRGGGVSSPELADMTLMTENSTAVRDGAQGMVSSSVAGYIAVHGLYALSAEGYYDRGRARYAAGDFGGAVNDFTAALDLGHAEAAHQLEMVDNVLSYRYTDYYNP